MRAAFIIKAVIHNIRHRLATFIISVMAVAVAFTFLSSVGVVSFGLAATAVNTSLRYPLVVGPEGSSDTQLVMSSIFNIDKPRGTLDYSVYEALLRDERVAAAYPMARSDSYRGVPIVGVNSIFLKDLTTEYHAAEDGFDPDMPFLENDLHRVVVGYKIAERYQIETGDRFFGSHGHVGDSHAHSHDNFEYRVAAIIAPVNGPEDYSIFAHYRAVWSVHDNHSCDHHDHGEDHKHDHETLTAVLVKTVNPVATAQLEGEYSAKPGSTATDVGKTVRRLVQYMNKAEQAAGFFSYGTLFIVLMMVFVTVLMSVNERKKEMALMRTLGIGRGSISLTVMIETMLITVLGIVSGLVSGHLALYLAKPVIDMNLGINLEPFMFTAVEIQGIIVTLIAGQFLALAAMLRIYSMNLIEEVSRD
jgi:putative ABC transport system permease protein